MFSIWTQHFDTLCLFLINYPLCKFWIWTLKLDCVLRTLPTPNWARFYPAFSSLSMQSLQVGRMLFIWAFWTQGPDLRKVLKVAGISPCCLLSLSSGSIRSIVAQHFLDRRPELSNRVTCVWTVLRSIQACHGLLCIPQQVHDIIIIIFLFIFHDCWIGCRDHVQKQRRVPLRRLHWLEDAFVREPCSYPLTLLEGVIHHDTAANVLYMRMLQLHQHVFRAVGRQIDRLACWTGDRGTNTNKRCKCQCQLPINIYIYI